MTTSTTAMPSAAAPDRAALRPAPINIYHLHPLVAGRLEAWPALFDHIASMGFSHVCMAPPFEPGPSGDIFVHATFERLHPILGAAVSAEQGLAQAVRSAEQAGLKLMLDIAPASIVAESSLHQGHQDWFAAAGPQDIADPRHAPYRVDVAVPRFERTDVTDSASEWWLGLLRRFASLGIAGFRCLTLNHTPAALWRRIRQGCAGSLLLAWTPGVEWRLFRDLAGCGFDLTCSSAGWWDGRAEWFLEEHAALSWIAPVLAEPEPSFLQRLTHRLPHDANIPTSYRLALGIAMATGAGLFLPMGFEYAARRPFDVARAGPADMDAVRAEAAADLTEDIRGAIRANAGLPLPRILRSIGTCDSPITALLRSDAADLRDARGATLVLINTDTQRPAGIDVPLAPLPAAAGAALIADTTEVGVMEPGETRLLRCRRASEIMSSPPVLEQSWAETTRIAVENVQPTVPGGNFPAKTVIGRDVGVAADVVGDGHDVLAADLLWRADDEASWHRVTMRKLVNDRWEAIFRPDRIGLYHFAVEGWWDRWGTYVHDMHAKLAAGQPVELEIEEGRQLVREALPRIDGEARIRLCELLDRPPNADYLLSLSVTAAMQQADTRPFATRSPINSIRVDRPAAEFASWYELFPRSATHDPKVHGTFRSVIERLPDIRAMGFDVLYFPPIHPIGRINRKGRNNSLRAEAGDVGSPYAIGSSEGGHDAVNPLLGTLDDFQVLQREAHAHGLELALDFAIQCAPDHPWLSQHKDWFRWRPDGSIRYAENPPKKYEDIVNPDFYGSAAFPAVWVALRDVIRFWVDQGVRIFRVDNPHTKPLPFWQWMIADIQSSNPDVLFLSEAFTRPKLMYRLAKIGFSQSYTYFTWRNTKQEITDYLTELTSPPVADFFRPNFFVNTPDINPFFLQTSGRPGFLIRAALAATLSGLWGIYSGFEICESVPLPGREEYLNSEKYEIRPRDYHAPGNIVAEIAALNRIRRQNPALQTHRGVRFYAAHNDQIILYGKRDPGGSNLILAAVSFDPHHAQDADIEVPVWELGLGDYDPVAVTELMHGDKFTWYGKNQRIRLDPGHTPFHIWRLSRVGAT
ncbi:MAG TPA: maltotransferase domain-containing protein [Rhodopila sp.]|nr:maltotransferase domain-containing protein [Rhodopila sp.]